MRKFEAYTYQDINELREILELSNILKVISNSSPTIGKLGYVILEVWINE